MGVLDFELFNLKDMFGKSLDNPEQLLLGAATPVGAKLWGEILGKDFEPMVNALGGPQGSGFLGLGSGGVFDRAREAGVSTGDASNIHNIAEVVAGGFAGGAGALGGSSGGAASGISPEVANALSSSAASSIAPSLAGAGAGAGTSSGAGAAAGLFGGFGIGDALDIAQQVNSLSGSQEPVQPAPTFNQAGGSTGFSPLRLGSTNEIPSVNNSVSNFFGSEGSIEDLIGSPKEQGQELASQVRADDKPTGLGAFFGNLDQNLQSPSKQIGLGLLSQIDPRLAQAGLLAGGFFGENKVFGQ